jgi:hypothetical protein
MAHAFAVAILGYEAFESMLIPIIDGNIDRFRTIIGGEPTLQPPVDFIYEIGLEIVRVLSGNNILIARIRLLSYLGTPTYIIAIAECRDDSFALPKHRNYAKPIKITFATTDGVPPDPSGV